MRQKVHFAGDGQPLSGVRYLTVLEVVGQTHGKPTLFQRGWPRGTPWGRALIGVDAVGERHWVVRVVTVDTETTKHICDDRCRMARSRTCACSCGGANHGIALIQCKAA
jgi:hypothetical protein